MKARYNKQRMKCRSKVIVSKIANSTFVVRSDDLSSRDQVVHRSRYSVRHTHSETNSSRDSVATSRCTICTSMRNPFLSLMRLAYRQASFYFGGGRETDRHGSFRASAID